MIPRLNFSFAPHLGLPVRVALTSSVIVKAEFSLNCLLVAHIFSPLPVRICPPPFPRRAIIPSSPCPSPSFTWTTFSGRRASRPIAPSRFPMHLDSARRPGGHGQFCTRGGRIARRGHQESQTARDFPFDDTDPYKVLEGASYALAVPGRTRNVGQPRLAHCRVCRRARNRTVIFTPPAPLIPHIRTPGPARTGG